MKQIQQCRCGRQPISHMFIVVLFLYDKVHFNNHILQIKFQINLPDKIEYSLQKLTSIAELIMLIRRSNTLVFSASKAFQCKRLLYIIYVATGFPLLKPSSCLTAARRSSTFSCIITTYMYSNQAVDHFQKDKPNKKQTI